METFEIIIMIVVLPIILIGVILILGTGSYHSSSYWRLGDDNSNSDGSD